MTNTVQEIKTLIGARGKHTNYQEIHPSIIESVGLELDDAPSKRETARQAFFDEHLDCRNARVLDIGANTGFFTFAAAERGARFVQVYEGYAPHAHFIKLAANALGLSDTISVSDTYYEFDKASETFDICICLNVLHHLGDDFGTADSRDLAKARMREAMRALGDTCDTLVFQLGYNWKGDRHLPLFDQGRKEEIVHFVEQAAPDVWRIDHVTAIAENATAYTPFGPNNAGRYDAMGEFANRPLFILRKPGA